MLVSWFLLFLLSSSSHSSRLNPTEPDLGVQSTAERVFHRYSARGLLVASKGVIQVIFNVFTGYTNV